MQQMTESEARSFDRFSVGNAAEVLRKLDCGCEPYVDVFTFNRWLAQGYAVQRGEKAIRLPIIKTVEDDDGEKTRKVLGTSFVFCRHQVKATGRKVEPETKPVASSEPAWKPYRKPAKATPVTASKSADVDSKVSAAMGGFRRI